MNGGSPYDDPDVIVVAGGRASRFPGKLGLTMPDGLTLVQTVVAGALDRTTGRVIVVGPADGLGPYADRVSVTREDPPFSGPLAAVAAAIPLTEAAEIVVLAGDAPAGPAAIPSLVTALRGGADAATVVDHAGRRQPLTAAYSRRHLIDRSGSPIDGAARVLLEGARVVEIPDQWGASRDIDTPQDYA